MAALTYVALNGMFNLTLRGDSFTSPANVWLSAMTAAGNESGGGTEVSGGGYARQPITFAAPSAGAVASDVAVTWEPLHTGADQAIVGWTIWDAVTAGSMLAFHTLASPLTIRANNGAQFDIGDITLVSSGAMFNDFLANKWLDHLFRNSAYTPPADPYMGHYTVIPTRSTAGTEVSDSAYMRIAVPFVTSVIGATVNDAQEQWNPLLADAGATLTGWALSDAITAGNELMFGPWSPSPTPAVGDTVTLVDDKFFLRAF